ncbi:hypothetical protein BGZ49_001011 [Haplosporangium sp. Z 27]|nr:hypothetical protein BGZ49_001011 [Haplosporangium sp. Z 27]
MTITIRSAVSNQDDKSETKELEACPTSIRCMGPYQVSESIWLTPVWLSDASEIFRVLNIDRTISEGLYSAKVVYPFPEASAKSFAERHLQKRNETGIVTSWAIRPSIDGPMIGLFAMDEFDHGEMGPCFRNSTGQDQDKIDHREPEDSNARNLETLNCGGVGYWMSPEYSGKGIMSQVLSYGLNKLARSEFGYDRVHSEAWIENKASQRVMEHAGMRRTVGVPCFVPKFNVTKDIAHYIIDTVPLAKLAPEIIIHILSFVHQEQPSSLLPILTVSKKWARLALELIYEQPVVNLLNLGSFVNTLTLQDRLQNGQKPFWDTNSASDSDPLKSRLEQNLGIDYRSMIKKPCRIVGITTLTKQDLINLWELQDLLWASPAFFSNEVLPSSAKGQTIAVTSPTTPPSPPSSSPSSSSSSSPSSPILSKSPLSTSDPEQMISHHSLESINQSITYPSPKRSTSPSHPKAVLVRQKKKMPKLIGPVVMLLDLSPAFTDTMQYVLDEVPGMRLCQLHYKSRLSTSLQDLLERNLSTIRELTFSRPPTRQDEFLAVAQLLSAAENLHTLKLDHCQTAGNTVISQFARSCGSSLENFDIRQHIMIRPLGDYSHFPVDGPEDWNTDPIVISSGSDNCAGNTNQEQMPLLPSIGQLCSHISTSTIVNPATSIESVVGQLINTGDIGESTAETPLEDNIPPDVDMESRMDLAIKEVGRHCRRLSSLRLRYLTWLSDDALSGFKPGQVQVLNRIQGSYTWYGGLREIEILDSYYGSRVTLEGILEICGPNLEVLVIDRKSCWRTKPDLSERCIMCSSCVSQYEARRAMKARMSTGDQLISGLIHKRLRLSRSSVESGVIKRLGTLVLIEHWVTLRMLKEAIEFWRLTLRVLNLRLFKCSIEDLTDAFMSFEGDSEITPALENLSLGLPWLNVDVDSDDGVMIFVNRLFDKYLGLNILQINKRVWRRGDVDIV